MGIPITLNILQTKVLCHGKSHDQDPNYKSFSQISQIYVEDVKQLKIFLKCSLGYSQFTNRYSSVSQKKSSKLKTIKY